MPLRVLVAFGTRPEAIKLCALVRRLQSLPHRFEVRTVVTAQHRSMLDQVLGAFQVTPDYDLDLMTARQTPTWTASRILGALELILEAERPQMVLVQGDTTTTFAAALAASYAGIPVGHVEAGLRSGDRSRPFPEEINRVLTTMISNLHFAATSQAAANLLREKVPSEQVFVTGNTVVDAVLRIRDGLAAGRIPRPDWPFPRDGRRLILVTCHRRETFGSGFERVCWALAALAERDDVEVVFPVHCNPNVAEPARRILGGRPQIHLLEPLEYAPFIDLVAQSYLLLTDSGGVQEEAPSLGKPVLVLRETTERTEALEAGTAKLVGTDPKKIVREAYRLLDDPAHYSRMAQAHSAFGDGHACERIVAALERYAEPAQPAARAMAAAGPVAVG